MSDKSPRLMTAVMRGVFAARRKHCCKWKFEAPELCGKDTRRQSGSPVISQQPSAELTLKGITQIPRRSANFAYGRIFYTGEKIAIKHDFIMYNNTFSIEYDDDTPYVGSLSDCVNDGELAHTLDSNLNTMFDTDHHKAGVLKVEEYSYGVIRNADKYYFTNSWVL
ncbi:uncharacterized protein CEXT_276741 [Caerostris extrusa]|uniref:Uncharacterized protein n=1 Tax=Caerostris extrusa TaxID=172846 RepID=A0AAV4QKH2_CAEEX|nr:uncharacterized protein CEXT_276741 [Caerostris extrusa]